MIDFDAFVSSSSAWLLTFMLHSTLLIAATWMLCSHWVRLPLAWQHRLWRVSLVGPALTTTAVLWLAGPSSPTALPWIPAAEATSPVVPLTSRPPEPTLVTTDLEAFATPTDLAPVPVLAQWSAPHTLAPLPAVAPVVPTATYPTPVSTATPSFDYDNGSRAHVATSATTATSVTAGLTYLAWAVVIALLAGVIASLATALGIVSAHRMLARRTRMRSGAARDTLDDLCAEGHVSAPVVLSQCDGLSSPVALLGREICLPRDLEHTLSPASLRAALAHELAHVEREDAMWMHIAAIVQALFFVQPLFRLARRRLLDSAEFLCDDQAVNLTHDGIGLAKCLAEVAAMQPTRPSNQQLLPAMATRRRPLLTRVARLLSDDSRPRDRSQRAAWAIVLTTAVVLSVGAPVVVDASATSDAVPAPEPPSSSLHLLTLDAASLEAALPSVSEENEATTNGKSRRAKRRFERAQRRAERARRQAEEHRSRLGRVDPQAAAALAPPPPAPATPLHSTPPALPSVAGATPAPSKAPPPPRATTDGPPPPPNVPMPPIPMPPLPPAHELTDVTGLVAATVGSIVPIAVTEGRALKQMEAEVDASAERVEAARSRVESSTNDKARRQAQQELSRAEREHERLRKQLDARAEKLERELEAMGAKLEVDMEKWAENFERDYGQRLEQWEREHASSIEASAAEWEKWGEAWAEWGESFGAAMEQQLGEDFEEQMKAIEVDAARMEREAKRAEHEVRRRETRDRARAERERAREHRRHRDREHDEPTRL